MARITKGILGGFSGKVGTVVGANWRGQDIIRSTPKRSGRKATGKQLLQQVKFSLVTGFLQPLKTIQTKYFGSASGSKSRVNLAVSYTISEAVQVTGEVPELVYSKVLITRGDLSGFQNITAVPQAGNVIRLAWQDNSAQGNASATDKANAVCYSEASGTFEIFESVAARSGLTADITLPEGYEGQEVQLWVYFSNTEETSASNSSYLGAVTLI